MVNQQHRIQPPEGARVILNTLEAAGHEAYVVGGCIRDSLLGRLPGDWDITTSAEPHQVQALFSHTIPTGIRHGTVTVLVGREPYEVTTYRLEEGYSDGRRPDSVRFVGSLTEDLARRDFTINALAWNAAEGVVDRFGGIADLERRVLRTVGDPLLRFGEDALRMLRAVRFSAQLDFSIDTETLAAIQAHAGQIRRVSAERIRVELDKWLLSSHPERWDLLRASRLMEHVLPELEACFGVEQDTPWHVSDVGTHSLQAAAFGPGNRALRWALLLHDIGKPHCRTRDEAGKHHFYGHELKSEQMAGELLHRLKFDNKTRHKIQRLILHHDREVMPAPRALRRAVRVIGEDLFQDWLVLRRCDLMAQNPAKAVERLARLDQLEILHRELMEREEYLTLHRLAISGWDLLELGIPAGPEVGRLLHGLLDRVIEEPGYNHREWLLQEAERMYGMKGAPS